MEKTSKKSITNTSNLQELRVDIVGRRPRRNSHIPSSCLEPSTRVPKISSRSTDFVYVNSAYVASVHDVRSQSETRLTIVPVQPPTSVVREQYWACSKWSKMQRFLAIAVGVLFATVVGLAVIVILNNAEESINAFFRIHSTPE